MAAGLDIWKWVNGEYPLRFMEETCAWYLLHSKVRAVAEDIAATASKKARK